MPHFTVEYSANLEPEVDIDDLLIALHQHVVDCGIFPLGGIRLRASKRDHYIIADGAAENTFVHLVARIGAGRPLPVKKDIGEKIFKAFCDYLQPTFETRPLAISFEIQEIDPELNFKKNIIHDILKQKQAD